MASFPRSVQRLQTLAIGFLTCIGVYLCVHRAAVTTRRAGPKTLYSRRPTVGSASSVGEMGAAVELTAEEREIVQNETEASGVSRYLQERVSLERSLPDYRTPECRSLHYPRDLPKSSVILIFHNELWRSLLRTVHSIVNRTPSEYLHEVILVDDASTATELGTPLDDYILSTWPDVAVRVVRLVERSGLIRTRLAGVAAATGEVVVIMDGHMEVTQGWIEPLLHQIQQNNRTLVAPLVGWIQVDTLEFSKSGDDSYQTFTWDAMFKWSYIPRGVARNLTAPLPTYALVGCAMAMNRRVFLEMGSFDEGMEIWGAENVELPLRIWMCGGRVEILPCSHVGHGYHAHKTMGDFVLKNAQRVAEVWFDEYKDNFYIVNPHMKGKLDYGDISARRKLRENLGCKSFRWFLENIMKPPIFVFNRDVLGWGKLRRRVGGKDRCLDALSGPGNEAGTYPCHFPRSVSQLFSLTTKGVLRNDYMYLRFDAKGKLLYKLISSSGVGDGPWRYNKKTKELFVQGRSLCLEETEPTIGSAIGHLSLKPCAGTPAQKWHWEHGPS